VLFAPAALRAQAGDPPVVREGPYWVRRTANVATCKPNGRLQVITRGSVTLRGADEAVIRSSLVQRARVRTAEEARRALDGAYFTTRVRGDLTQLIVILEDRPGVAAHLDLTVPRTLAETIVETQSGDVDSSDLAGTVHALTACGRIQLDRIQAGAIARTGSGEIRIGWIGGPVRAASSGGSVSIDRAGGETWVDTAGGEIAVREVAGPLFAATEGGNIKVGRALAAVQARSAAGLIEVVEAAGMVTAETRQGSIQIGAARGARCESGEGTIRLRGVAGPVRCATASGSILAEWAAGGRIEDSFLAAGAGDVTVRLPSNLPVMVKARNDSPELLGRIVSDFPQIRVRTLGFEFTRPAVAEGALNGGGPTLRINAAGGTIFLRKQR
jgi:hypothetical protein